MTEQLLIAVILLSLYLVIVRGVTAEGVSEDLLTKEAYQVNFQKILANACYFVTVTVHA